MEPIRVFVRVRPDETPERECCVHIRPDDRTVSIAGDLCRRGSEEAPVTGFTFEFDKAFPAETSQEEVFDAVLPILGESVKGFEVTIFAYGQTGSGKTHTISGTPQAPGILQKSVQHIFSDLQTDSDVSQVAMIYLSYIELYNNVLYDLLSSQSLSGNTTGTVKLHEHPDKGVIMTGSSSLRTPVSSVSEVMDLLSRGNRLRATSTTLLNERSSRSHAVVVLDIECKTFPSDGSSSSGIVKVSRVNFVDLAGSERVKMSGASGKVLDETKYINKALTCLGDVLSALSKHYKENPDGNSHAPLCHVPYRDSKLTMLLKSSLGGHAKTVMVATIRNSTTFFQQSLITLRYAARTRHIKNCPIKNVSKAPKSSENFAELQKLRSQLDWREKECAKLRSLLICCEKETDTQSVADLKKKYEVELESLRRENFEDATRLKEKLDNIVHDKATISSELNKTKAKITDVLKLHANIQLEKEKAEETNFILHRKLREGQNIINRLKLQNEEIKLGVGEVHKPVASIEYTETISLLNASKEKYKSKYQQLEKKFLQQQELIDAQCSSLHKLHKQICQNIYNPLSGMKKKSNVQPKCHDFSNCISATENLLASCSNFLSEKMFALDACWNCSGPQDILIQILEFMASCVEKGEKSIFSYDLIDKKKIVCSLKVLSREYHSFDTISSNEDLNLGPEESAERTDTSHENESLLSQRLLPHTSTCKACSAPLEDVPFGDAELKMRQDVVVLNKSTLQQQDVVKSVLAAGETRKQVEGSPELEKKKFSTEQVEPMSRVSSQREYPCTNDLEAVNKFKRYELEIEALKAIITAETKRANNSEQQQERLENEMESLKQQLVSLVGNARANEMALKEEILVLQQCKPLDSTHVIETNDQVLEKHENEKEIVSPEELRRDNDLLNDDSIGVKTDALLTHSVSTVVEEFERITSKQASTSLSREKSPVATSPDYCVRHKFDALTSNVPNANLMPSPTYIMVRPKTDASVQCNEYSVSNCKDTTESESQTQFPADISSIECFDFEGGMPQVESTVGLTDFPVEASLNLASCCNSSKSLVFEKMKLQQLTMLKMLSLKTVALGELREQILELSGRNMKDGSQKYDDELEKLHENLTGDIKNVVDADVSSLKKQITDLKEALNREQEIKAKVFGELSQSHIERERLQDRLTTLLRDKLSAEVKRTWTDNVTITTSSLLI